MLVTKSKCLLCLPVVGSFLCLWGLVQRFDLLTLLPTLNATEETRTGNDVYAAFL